jgi:hypothetical protein
VVKDLLLVLLGVSVLFIGDSPFDGI